MGDTSCTYLDKDVKSSGFYIKPRVTYTYTVRAYVMNDGKKKFGAHSAGVSAKTEMGTTATTVRTNNNMYNSLSWNKIDGADGYYVYRRIPGNSWECIKVLKGGNSLKYQDKKVKSLETYQYMVRAYRSIEGKKWYSPYHCRKNCDFAGSSKAFYCVLCKRRNPSYLEAAGKMQWISYL